VNSRILNHVTIGDAPAIVSEPLWVTDDATRDAILVEAEQAYQRGLAEGRRAAMDEARAESAAVADAVARGAATLAQTLVAQHTALADALAIRVIETTRAVIGREPTDEGLVLVERLHGAIARTDEIELVIRVAGGREAVVAEALAGRAGVTYEVDTTLGADDVIVTGAFSRLDLRTETLLAALTEILVSQPPLGSLRDDEADELGAATHQIAVAPEGLA
jgi:flagellar biosynthesis/type III secretory pathway protein FliH